MHPKDIPLKFAPEEIFFRQLLRLIAFGYALAAGGYLWMGSQLGMTRLAPPLLTSTLVTKVLLLALLALTAAGNIRYARTPVYLLIAANAITAIVAVILWWSDILTPPTSVADIPDIYLPVPSFLAFSNNQISLVQAQPFDTANMLKGSVIYDVIVCGVAYYLQWRVDKVQYDFCKFLKPVEYDVVYALADVLIHDGTESKRERLSPAEVATNVDQFLYQFPGKRTATLAVAMRLIEYLPFIWNFATFSYLNTADRRQTLEGHFIKSGIKWRGPLKSMVAWLRRKGRVLSVSFRKWTRRIEALIPNSNGWRFVVNLVCVPFRAVLWVIMFVPNAISLWQHVIRGLIVSVKQLVYTGYYQDEGTHASIGYTPFSKRGLATPTPTPAAALNVIKGEAFNYGKWVTAQQNKPQAKNAASNPVIIIGTGAAASIIAHYLVHQNWYVLMVERGPYVQASDFSENEIEGSSKLYSDGLLQISTNLQLQVAQGRCVGGGTTVNNGICIVPPTEVIKHWHQCMGGQLDMAQLDAAIAEVKRLLNVQPQTQNLNPSGEKFVAGVKAVIGDEAHVPTVEANIANCVGCGYCNTGCKYDHKKSALVWLLPKANATQRLTIISDCEVTRINTRNSAEGKTVTDLECQVASGGKLRLSGCAYIVSAGAIASSVLLQRSGLGGSRVGKDLSFNIGAVMTGHFDETINAYAGLQMSHTYSQPTLNRELDYMLETWFNPPVTQATRMPGWFEDHFNNMKDYAKMMSIGVLVGSTSKNVVMNLNTSGNLWQSIKLLWQREATFWELAASAITGSNIVFKAKDDFERVLAGLRLAGKVMLRSGAKAVMPSTFHYLRFSSETELEAKLTSSNLRVNDLLLASAHPQGGNALSATPRDGVVSPDFRLHGATNLFICDASIFPSSVKVNPQLTIMGLAHYAVKQHIEPMLARL